MDGGIREADSTAAADENEVRGTTVVIILLPRRAVRGPCLALLSVSAHVNESAEHAKAVIDGVGRSSDFGSGGEGRCLVVGV